MPDPKITISPKTKVGELLDNYPELESVLMELSPAFEKLKNPVLRRTVARVATLQQIAVVGGLSVDAIVNRLRKETGQSISETENAGSEYLSDTPPSWFDEKLIVRRFDASPLINSGGSPMNEILHQSGLLNPGEIFEFKTPFIPAPIIDMLKGKNYKAYCTQKDGSIFCCITKG
jgi:hypothetical protein